MDSLSPTSPASAAPRLRCLLLCDLANSTGLIDALGDLAAAELIRRHDRLARELVHRHNGREIDKTDGFLLLFERPLQAVAFALAYQRCLRHLSAEIGQPLRVRVGIHVGEVLTWNNRAEDVADGAKPLEVEGLAKAIAARLMNLALPGQILLSESAHTLALRARNELDSSYQLRWIEHGRYRLQGVVAPLRVFEVGENGVAPATPPPNHAKARRVLHWWQWKPLYAVLALAAVALPVYWLLQPNPAIAFAERDWIVVADLRNLTGETRFDDSLDTAIRIGLEQSRHVNLVANLKTRDTLKLMQRDPTDKIDRDVGSELAQRVGARALLLPSLAEVGGRMRFTAELVDPLTATTVYTHSSEARGESDVVNAVDEVLSNVRGDLGESLQKIDQTSEPLVAVTTQSLEALRAYSRGRAAANESRLDDAADLYEEALKIDPAFDQARLGLAALSLNRDQPERARQLLGSIGANRLSIRNRLYSDALLAMIEAPPDLARHRWELLTEMYPDDFAGLANAAIVSVEMNQHSRADVLIKRTLVPLNPWLATEQKIQAEIALVLGDAETARTMLEQSVLLGSNRSYNIFFSVPAASRDFTSAQAVIDEQRRLNGNQTSSRIQLHDVAMLLHQGRWRSAYQLLLPEESDGDPEFRSAEHSELALFALAGALDELDDQSKRMSAFLDRQMSIPIDASLAKQSDAVFRALSLALIAARHSQLDIATQALQWTSGRTAALKVQTNQQLRAAVIAELSLPEQRSEEALEQLQDLLDGTELFQVRVTHMRLSQQADQGVAALADATWIAGNVGRAYSEARYELGLQAQNLIDFNLALLMAAELLHRSGDARAAEMKEHFVNQVPATEFGPSVRRRLQNLR